MSKIYVLQKYVQNTLNSSHGVSWKVALIEIIKLQNIDR